jgi:hypothetical protein
MQPELLLYTRLAQSLFKGSWRHGKMGLLQFAHLMAILSKAAKENDAHASECILKTEQTLVETREKLKSIEQALTHQLTSQRGIQVNIASSDEPLCFTLKFSTRFGFMGAYLLADADYILRQIRMAKRMGLLLPEEITVNTVVTYLRDVFAMPRHGNPKNITLQTQSENEKSVEQSLTLIHS